MAGRIIVPRSDAITAADNNGWVTVASVTNYYLKALVTLASNRISLNYTTSNGGPFAGALTGGTSGATATVVSDTNAGPGGAASGTLVVSTITGTFIVGETITAGANHATLASVVTSCLDGQIIEIDASNNKFRLRAVAQANDTRSKFNYGGQDVSAFNTNSTVFEHAQLIYNVNDAPLT